MLKWPCALTVFRRTTTQNTRERRSRACSPAVWSYALLYSTCLHWYDGTVLLRFLFVFFYNYCKNHSTCCTVQDVTPPSISDCWDELQLRPRPWRGFSSSMVEDLASLLFPLCFVLGDTEMFTQYCNVTDEFNLHGKLSSFWTIVWRVWVCRLWSSEAKIELLSVVITCQKKGGPMMKLVILVI